MITGGKSFSDAGALLVPELSIDGHLLNPGHDSSTKWKKSDFKELRLERIGFMGETKSDDFFSSCNLKNDSELKIVVDVECPDFELRATLFCESFDPNRLDEFSDRHISSLPSQILRAGSTIRLMVVATAPNPSSALGCNQRGGVLFSWETSFPPSNRGGMFPIRQERVEGFWTVDLLVNDIVDLSKPIRSAVCLRVDGRHFSELLGERADSSVIRQTSNWLMIETYTNLIMRVLAKEDLVAHFDKYDPRALKARRDLDKSEKRAEGKKIADYWRKLDHRSIEDLLFRLFAYLDSPPSSLRDDFLDDSIDAQSSLRDSFGRRFQRGVD